MSATIQNMTLGDSAFDFTANMPFVPGGSFAGLKVSLPTLASVIAQKLIEALQNGSLVVNFPQGEFSALPDSSSDGTGNLSLGNRSGPGGIQMGPLGTLQVGFNGTVTIGGAMQSLSTGYVAGILTVVGGLALPSDFIAGPFTLPFPCDGYVVMYGAGGTPWNIPSFLTPPS
jgi:hypothetical protein